MNTKVVHQEREFVTGASFGIASLKDNAKNIEKTLNIKSLKTYTR